MYVVGADYRIKTAGNMTRVDLLAEIDLQTARTIIAETSNYQGSLRLFDFSYGGHFALEPDEIRQLAEYGRAMMPPTVERVAFVAPADIDFGLLRMYRVYRDAGEEKETHRVFRNVDEALEWLNAESGRTSG